MDTELPLSALVLLKFLQSLFNKDFSLASVNTLQNISNNSRKSLLHIFFPHLEPAEIVRYEDSALLVHGTTCYLVQKIYIASF